MDAAPSQKEAEELNLNHAVLRTGRLRCAKGSAESYRHAKKVQNEGEVPTIGLHYMHTRGEHKKEEKACRSS